MTDISASIPSSGDTADLLAAAEPDGFQAFLALTGQHDTKADDATLRREWREFRREEMHFLRKLEKAALEGTVSLTAIAGAHIDEARPVEDETGAAGHLADAYGTTQGDDGAAATHDVRRADPAA